MTKLEKLSISGIRSYSSNESVSIKFLVPLTVIVGRNGSGKTSIIEALKFVATGVMPPDSANGQHFVNDPRGSLDTVSASVKLAFKTPGDQKVVAERYFKLHKTATRKTFKSADGVIHLQDSTGTFQSSSHKTTDFEKIVPSLLGASRAVLENVVFCHQDDALWPLAEKSVVKTKFDSIFCASKFTRGLEAISDFARSCNKKHKEALVVYERARTLKEQADELCIQRENTAKTVDRCLAEKQELEKEIMSKQEVLSALEAKVEQISAQENESKKFELQLANLDEKERELRNKLAVCEETKESVVLLEERVEQENKNLACLEEETIRQKTKFLEKEAVCKVETGRVERLAKKLAIKFSAENTDFVLLYEVASAKKTTLETENRDLENKLAQTTHACQEEKKIVEKTLQECKNKLLGCASALAVCNENKKRLHSRVTNLLEKVAELRQNGNLDEELKLLDRKIADTESSLATVETADYAKLKEEWRFREIHKSGYEAKKQLERNEEEVRRINNELSELRTTLAAKTDSPALVSPSPKKTKTNEGCSAFHKALLTPKNTEKTCVTAFWKLKDRLKTKKENTDRARTAKESEVAFLDKQLAEADLRVTALFASAENSDWKTLQNETANTERALELAYKQQFVRSALKTHKSNSCFLCKRPFGEEGTATKYKKTLEQAAGTERPDLEGLKKRLTTLRARGAAFEQAVAEQTRTASYRKKLGLLKEELSKLVRTSSRTDTEVGVVHELQPLVLRLGELAKTRDRLLSENKDLKKRHATDFAAIAKRGVFLEEVKFVADENSLRETLSELKARRRTATKTKEETVTTKSALNSKRLQLLGWLGELRIREDAEKDARMALAAVEERLDTVETRLVRETALTQARLQQELIPALDAVSELLAVLQTFPDSESLAAQSTKVAALERKLAEQRAVAAETTARLQNKRDYEELQNQLDALVKTKTEVRVLLDQTVCGNVEPKDSLLRKTASLRESVTAASLASSKLEGRLAEQTAALQQSTAQLASTRFAEVDDRARTAQLHCQLFPEVAGECVRLHKDLEFAILDYHALKIREVNELLGDLWQTVYRSADIERVWVESVLEGESVRKKHSYSYAVMMQKAGVALPMRGRCSAGQRVLVSLLVRLALSEAFCSDCGFLALDEPTTNLDEENVDALAEALVALAKRRTAAGSFQLLLITHDEKFVQKLRVGQLFDEFYRIGKNIKGNSKIYKKAL